MTRVVCHCRLCLALDEADAWIADHGGRPAQAARHLARQSPGLLSPVRFAKALRERGVDVAPGYMSACSEDRELGGAPGTCPAAARVAAEIMHVPLYPGLRPTDLDRIASAIVEADRLLR